LGVAVSSVLFVVGEVTMEVMIPVVSRGLTLAAAT